MTTIKNKSLMDMIIERDGRNCFYCDRSTSKKARKYLSGVKVPYDFEKAKLAATFDHIVPRSKGGETVVDNAVIACHECNRDKGDMSAEEFLKIIKNNC